MIILALLCLIFSITYVVVTLIASDKNIIKIITPPKRYKLSLAQIYLIQPWLCVLGIILTIIFEKINTQIVTNVIFVLDILIAVSGIRICKHRTSHIKLDKRQIK